MSGDREGTTRVGLRLESEEWDGWTDVEIVRSIDRIAGAFALGLTERWPGQSERRKIFPGMRCRLAVDGEVVITGWIDDVEMNYSATTHQVVVRGRDNTGDLFDSYITRPPYEFGGLKLDDVVRRICAPFNIPVEAQVDVGRPIERFAIQPCESFFDAIERACRMRAVLPVADGRGGLLLTRAGKGGKAAARLQLGGADGNILTGGTTISMKELFSDYTVLGSAAAPSSPGQIIAAAFQPNTRDGPPVSPRASISDPAVTRFRPFGVLAEAQGNAVTLRQRAEWQRAVAVGKSVKGTRVVQDWRAGKSLWHPNTLTRVTDDFANFNDQEMLISATKMTLNESGTLTELTLALPDAYALIPEGDITGQGDAHYPFSAWKPRSQGGTA